MTSPAATAPLRLRDPDALYEQLLDAQRGMSPDDCMRFYARLVLLLAQAVGDDTTVAASIKAAASPGPVRMT